MSLDKFNFRLQSHYVGVWSISDIHNQEIFGTLFTGIHNNIWIELCSNDNINDLPKSIGSIIGCTYSTNLEGEESAVNIIAEGLEFLFSFNSGIGVKHYKYSVSSIYLYEGNVCKDSINNIYVRIPILDKWAKSLMLSAYHNDAFSTIPTEHHLIYHVLPEEYTLLRNNGIYISIKFPCRYHIGTNQSVEQKAFLYISLNHSTSYPQMMRVVNQYHYLFILLTNCISPLEYVYSEKGLNTTLYIINDFLSYRYTDKQYELNPRTISDDYTREEINSIFSKWKDYYEEHYDALNLYFDSLLNIYTSYETRIRNYISVLDALTKSINGQPCSVNSNSKRSLFVSSLFEKYNFTPDEKNKLKTWLLQYKGNELKPRITELLSLLGEYIPDRLDADFVEKIVNTRNNITHPSTLETNIFLPSDYNIVSNQLSCIIRSFVLNQLGVPELPYKKLL